MEEEGNEDNIRDTKCYIINIRNNKRSRIDRE